MQLGRLPVASGTSRSGGARFLPAGPHASRLGRASEGYVEGRTGRRAPDSGGGAAPRHCGQPLPVCTGG